MKMIQKALLTLAFLVASSFGIQAQTAHETAYQTHSKAFMFESEKPWEDLGKGVKRQILGYNGQIMMVKIKFEKGAEGTPHRHYHTQLTYIVKGKFKFTVGDETKIVEAGDALYMAPDVIHGCVCLEPGMLIDCFSPMRAEFIGLK